MASIKDMKIGGPAKGTSRRSAKPENSTEKELQRLRRIDLLELLLDEIRQNEENTTRLKDIADLNDRLNAKIEDQEAQIKRLRDELAAKDAEIARMQANNELLAHSRGYLDVDELLRVQRLAVHEYLSRIPKQEAATRSSCAPTQAVPNRTSVPASSSTFKPAHAAPSSPAHGAPTNRAGE
jgi:septal ring factor EnvC (AmiA/AmiB activator)